MSDDGSITLWVKRLGEGDRQAVQRLWQVYFHRLVGLARKRLEGLRGAAADEEDVALSAFKSFCLRAEQGKFPDIEDRDGLWEVLVLLTKRKVINLIKHETQQKRDVRRVVRDAGETPLLAQLISDEPDPALAAELAENFEELLDALKHDGLRAVALLKLEGFSNEEIAQKIDYSVPTVERRLAEIRQCWQSRRTSREENGEADGPACKKLT